MESTVSSIEDLSFLPYIIDQWQDGEQYYTFLNYVRGIFLGDYVRKNFEFTEKELISLGLQVCDILQEFEKRNILAEEIWYVDNVMLSSDFRISFLDGSSLSQRNSMKAVSRVNLKAAILFMRTLCDKNELMLSNVLNKDFKSISQLRKNFLALIKRRPIYKKMKWRQRVIYMSLLCAFAGNTILLYKNTLLYREDSLLNAGELAFQNEKYEQAIINYQNVLSINSDNIVARRGIAESYWKEGNIEKAEECFQKNVNDFQDDIGAIYLQQIWEDKALTAFTEGNYEEALKSYLELENVTPDSQYEEMLLYIYLRQNDFDQAKSLIQELRSQELRKDFMDFVDEVYYMLERNEEASAEFCKLADLIAREDWLELSDKFRTKAFTRLCEKYGGNTYCRYEGDTFIKIFKNGSVYLGEMEQDERCGQGKLVMLSQLYNNIIIYDGIWNNDLPNGRGIQRAVIIPYLKEGRQIWLSIEGNYINGYSDGELFTQEYEVTGTEKKVIRFTTFKSTMGYLEPLKGYEIPEEYEYAGNVIGIWNTGEFQFSHDNHIDSVAGLGLSECYFNFNMELDE